MFIMFLVILGTVPAYLMLNKPNKYSLAMALYFLSLAGMTFSAILYLSKVTSFDYTIAFDKLIYMRMARYRIPINYLVRIFNLSLALFLLQSAVYFNAAYGRNVLTTVLAMPPIILAYLTDPSCRRKLFLLKNGENNFNIEPLEKIFGIVFAGVTVLYVLMPLAIMLARYRQTKVLFRKRSALITLCCIALIDMYFILAMYTFGFKNLLFYNINDAALPKDEFSMLEFISGTGILFVILFTAAVLLVVFKPYGKTGTKSKKNMLIYSETYNKSLSMELHIYKNVIIGMRDNMNLIQYAMAHNRQEDIGKIAKRGIDVCNTYLKMIEDTLRNVRSSYAASSVTNAMECLRKAGEVTPIPRDIHFEVCSEWERVPIRANTKLITEMFVNMINNSVDAVKKTNKNDGKIVVTVSCEEDMWLFNVWDNGCGIDLSDRKNIFQPFFTTKVKGENSGVGLWFVKCVIDEYGGEILVSSKPGEFTEFQIALKKAGEANG